MELGYWNVKGRAELIRILLAYFNLEYKEVHPTSPEDAHSLFAKHHFTFPNLPYLVDGDVHLTESHAIPIYLAQKAKRDDFFGKPGLDQVHHAEITGVLGDLVEILLPSLYKDNAAEFLHSKHGVFEKKFNQLSQLLGEKEFLLGYITYADFRLFIIVHLYTQIAKALKLESGLDKHPNLVKHKERIASLPGVKDYLASDAAKSRPFLPHAKVVIE